MRRGAEEVSEQLVSSVDEIGVHAGTTILTTVGWRAVTWLLCDYGEVLCVAPPAPDRAALEAAAGWDVGDRGGTSGRPTGLTGAPTTGPT